MTARKSTVEVVEFPAHAEADYPNTAERVFMDNVARRAVRYGLKAYHTHDSRRSEPGFPDLVLLGPGGGIAWECKTATGSATVAQLQWIALFEMAGFEAKVIRPADIRSGYIQHHLARLCKPPQLDAEAQLRAEIERLNASLSEADAVGRILSADLAQRDTRIEKLEADLARLRMVRG